MKLELKHIAPYLPYKIKVLVITNPCKDEIHTLSGILYDGLLNLGGGGMYGFLQRQYKDIKPILRPLSDLSNGDLDYLLDVHSTDFFADTNYKELTTRALSRGDLHHYIEFLPYGLVQWFLKEHYDIYGLIENGLAIDINTLEK